MGRGFQVLLAATLVAGLLAAWARIRADRDANDVPTHLRHLGWTLALALLTVSVLVTLSGTFEPYGVRAWMLVVAVAVVLAFRPRLAPRFVPAGLILLGLAGFLLAREHMLASAVRPAPELAGPGPNGGSVSVGPPGDVPAGNWGTGQSLVLAMAFSFV